MTTPPPFRTVLRGFEPSQVTTAVSELTTSLSIAQRTAAERTVELAKSREREAELAEQLNATAARLLHAENGSGRTGPGDVGTRVAAILALAEDEAAQRRSEADRYAEEVRRVAEAEATRMKAAAVSSADSILAQASQEVAAQREATAAAEGRLREAERTAAQIIDSARQEATREGRRIQAEFEDKARVRDEIQRQLVDVSAMLEELDVQLAEEWDGKPRSTASSGTVRQAAVAEA